MAINVYEGMFIFDSGRYGRDPEGVSGAVAKIVEDAGGELLVSRLWEERRLAYPIKGQRKGTYWLTYFRIDGRQLPQIDRQSELDNNVLRSLFLKVDPRIVDALVEHALAGTVRPKAEEKAEGKESAKESATEGAPQQATEPAAATATAESDSGSGE